MQITLLKSKIHRATVTQAHLHYVGSVTIDEQLMDMSGIRTNERVQLVNIANGERLETYAIPGPRDSGVIGLNGPAARKAQLGDLILVIAYAAMTPEEAEHWNPTVVFVDENNQVAGLNHDAAEAPEHTGEIRGDTITS